MTRNTIDLSLLSAVERQQLQDLITECSNAAKNADDNTNKPGNFPVSELDEDVQVRTKGASKALPRPQTYSSLATKKKEDSFDCIRVPCGLEIPKLEKCIKIKKNHKIRLSNGQLQIIDEDGKIIYNANMKKGMKSIKKEVEMMDTENKIHRFYFSTSKDMKQFIEMGKSLWSSPKNKSSGPWTQLLKLLKKRSSRDLLELKGILKNEPIFGNVLSELCDDSNPVPEVITRIVKLIEEPENITSVGLYRASGNLAVVQHIRCEIDCGKWDVLEKYRKDVDVLTGTLKLFFRELKEPLIPHNFYQKLRPLAITGSQVSYSKTESEVDSEIINIIESLPKHNKAILLYIVKHLLKVCSYKEENKMDLHNISICWGPSLTTYPASCNDLVSQTTEFTAITERLLECYNKISDKKEVNSDNDTDFMYEVVKKITSLVELNLNVEGIYWKSGLNTKIDTIVKLIDTKDSKYLNEIDKYTSKNDVHDLCCALKKYVGTLQEPLIPDEFFNHYCQVCDILDISSLRKDIREKIDQLPKTKRVFLLLMQHLRKVLEHEKANKLTVEIMADVWMAVLIHPSVQQNKKQTQKFRDFFHLLINLHELALPDLLQEPEYFHSKSRESRYDNVDDIYEEEISSM